MMETPGVLANIPPVAGPSEGGQSNVPRVREGPVTQMRLPLAPSRAAWEVAAAAAWAEGRQPARPARGKQRHLLFPRSFPAAPSETQPAGRPAAAGPCPHPPRPRIGLQEPEWPAEVPMPALQPAGGEREEHGAGAEARTKPPATPSCPDS